MDVPVDLSRVLFVCTGKSRGSCAFGFAQVILLQPTTSTPSPLPFLIVWKY